MLIKTSVDPGGSVANRLSYSQIRLYSEECGKKYEFYYKHKLRERTKSGALMFGTAFDKATEAVAKDRTIDEKAVFDEAFTHQEINGRAVHVPDSTLIVYAAADWDADLLQDEDMKFLKAKMAELLPEETDVIAAYEKCAAAKKQRAFKRFSVEENKFLNLCSWMCLRRKGHLMLDTNRAQILPRIKEVKGTQVKVDLHNDGGDSLIGYIDLHAVWEDGSEVIFDYKTSATEYDEDAVIRSPQLTIYTFGTGVKKAGFFVFKKAIKKNRIKICEKCGFDGSGARHKTCSNEVEGKRCHGEWKETIRPEAEVQILIDEIPARTQEIVLENIATVNKAIAAEIFPRNLRSCRAGYGDCPYLNLCFKNDKSDLEQM